MRTAFINELIAQARTNPKIFLVVGDLGFSVIEPFAEEFPDRYLNAGVAEQNMTGVAAGLASEGYHVFTYSIANFPTLRCLEQIRNDIAYHQLPVTVVAVGGGVAYGNLGYSHHAVQDIAALRGLPNLTVYSPADPDETSGCLRLALQRGRPSYLRLGKAGEKKLHEPMEVAAGVLKIRDGTAPVAFAATGSVLKCALEAADLLAQRGVQAAVYSCPILSAEMASNFAPLWRHQRIVSVEEHGYAGGFGSFLKELAPSGVQIRLCAIPETVASMVGGQDYLRKKAGLDAESLAGIAAGLA
ncbi:MAG TPA: transketolase C-terminal domain-containing protein [Verrucomicrobiae bacterium]|nr:transketolase C-terminal domain-containing protein [Verrucomicrobiae bacterium]